MTRDLRWGGWDTDMDVRDWLQYLIQFSKHWAGGVAEISFSGICVVISEPSVHGSVNVMFEKGILQKWFVVIGWNDCLETWEKALLNKALGVFLGVIFRSFVFGVCLHLCEQWVLCAGDVCEVVVSIVQKVMGSSSGRVLSEVYVMVGWDCVIECAWEQCPKGHFSYSRGCWLTWRQGSYAEIYLLIQRQNSYSWICLLIQRQG